MWSRSMVEPGQWSLAWSGVKVADLIWCQTPVHEHVAMDRILEALARPSVECVPALVPVWRYQRRTPLRFWGGADQVVEVQIGTVEHPAALVVWWYPVDGREVRGIGGWSQRMVDGLNAGHGHDLVRLQPPAYTSLRGPLEHEAVA